MRNPVNMVTSVAVEPTAPRDRDPANCPITAISAILKSTCSRFDSINGTLKTSIFFPKDPSVRSCIFCFIFNMADIAVIGQFAGSLSLGAVGSTATLVTMFTGFLIGLSGGINVLTALYYGAKDKDSLSKTIHSAALVSLIMGIFLLVLGVGLSE